MTMKARWARPLYFLRALNEEDPSQTRWGEGEDVETLRQMLFTLAAHLRDKTPITTDEQRRIGKILSEYAQVTFRVDFHDPAAGPIRKAGGEGGLMQHTELRAYAIAKSGHSRAGVYVEAILSLLEACEDGRVELRTCLECGQWFVPYSRTRTPKFCSPKCRTRFHYRAKKGATFRCAICDQETPIHQFSGLSKVEADPNGSDTKEQDVVAGGVDDPNPICLTCALANVPPGWQDYVDAVTYGRLG